MIVVEFKELVPVHESRDLAALRVQYDKSLVRKRSRKHVAGNPDHLTGFESRHSNSPRSPAAPATDTTHVKNI